MARACSLPSLIAPLLPFSHHLLAASRATDSADDAFMSHPEPTRASKKQVIAPMSETPEEFRQRVNLINRKFYENFEKFMRISRNEAAHFATEALNTTSWPWTSNLVAVL